MSCLSDIQVVIEQTFGYESEIEGRYLVLQI